MPLESKRVVRVTGIPQRTTVEQYREFVTKFSEPIPQAHRLDLKSLRVISHFKKKHKGDKGTLATASQSTCKDQSDVPLMGVEEPQSISFSFQHGEPIGTIAFSSRDALTSALIRHNKAKKNSCYLWRDWEVQRSLHGLTVLHQYANAEEIKMDICAIHGLGGNAIDTWTAKNGKMWLRDYLPSTEYFIKSRIMTFGYDSDLTNKKSVMTVDSWSDSLLHYLCHVRTSEKEKARPLILVCHSLGGLVAKKAMSKLPNMHISGVDLALCGLVFLATPHSGTTRADWDDFIIAAADLFLGVRTSLINKLRPFNDSATEAASSFLTLTPRPPFRCFAEGLKMDTKLGRKHIVSQASATLDPTSLAHVIMGTDHATICKFDSNLDAFMVVNSALNQVYVEITGASTKEKPNQHRMYGHPRFVAHAYPPQGKYWWEGRQLKTMQYQLNSRRAIVGRNEELSVLEAAVSTPPTRPRLTAIKGIAGIGKTELLSQFAIGQKNRRNVFFLGDEGPKSAEESMAEICMDIGFEMIEDPCANWERWQKSSASERFRLFTEWLGNECNKDSLLILDDAYTFGPSSIQSVLELPAWHIITSTRDSTMRWTDREFLEVILRPLTVDATVSILRNTLESLSTELSIPHQLELSSIAHALHGHPLAAHNTIPFILAHFRAFDDPGNEFVRLLETGSLGEKQIFLKFKAQSRSLWDVFEDSFQLLKHHEGSQDCARLLKLLPYLRIDHACFYETWKMNKGRKARDTGCDPHASILRSNYLTISDWLEKLRSVSFILNDHQGKLAKTLEFHPLVRQYALARFNQEDPRSLAKEVALFFHEVASIETKTWPDFIQPHILHYLGVCAELGFSPNDLGLPSSVALWLEDASNIIASRNDGPDGLDIQVTDDAKVEPTAVAIQNFIAKCNTTHLNLDAARFREGDHEALQMVLGCVKMFKKVKDQANEFEGHQTPVLLSQLAGAAGMLSEMVRLTSLYPDLPDELGHFSRRIQAWVDRGTCIGNE